jgi:DNA-binding MarR family transcriptional regulator
MAKQSNGLDRSPTHLLHRASQAATDIFAAEMKGKSTLTPRQLALLVTVAGNEGRNQLRLGELTGIDRSTLADLVKRLQRKGLLQRQRSREDARAYAVKLTDQGRRVLRTAEPLAKRVEERLLGALPQQRRGELIEQLQTIVEKLQGLAEPSARRGASP